jgi:hypothetical protein
MHALLISEDLIYPLPSAVFSSPWHSFRRVMLAGVSDTQHTRTHPRTHTHTHTHTHAHTHTHTHTCIEVWQMQAPTCSHINHCTMACSIHKTQDTYVHALNSVACKRIHSLHLPPRCEEPRPTLTSFSRAAPARPRERPPPCGNPAAKLCARGML